MDLEKEAYKGIELDRRRAIAILKYLEKGVGEHHQHYVMDIDRVGALMLYIRLKGGEIVNCDYTYKDTDRRLFFDVEKIYIDAVGHIVGVELKRE
jgi:hypothetical protein